MLRITEYAQKLLDGLDHVDFIEAVKTQQRNWIGRSEGAEVDFRLADKDEKLRVFTTRPDTLFGATYMVVCARTSAHREVQGRDRQLRRHRRLPRRGRHSKSDFERTELAKDKTGVQIDGIRAVNPVNGKEIPIWVSDYVLMSYGTGAIMAVPAHDTRDWEFATKFGLPMVEVVAGGDMHKGSLHRYRGRRDVSIPAISSTACSVADAKKKIIDWLVEKGLGERKVNYKLRDWVFSPPALLGRAHPRWCYCEHCGCGARARGASCPYSCPTWKTTSPPTTAKAPWQR